MYRLTGWALIALAIFCAVPTVRDGWGLGALVVVGGIVGGGVILTDRRPPRRHA